ncbi:hypothetical protein Y032_0006g3111 [Ancylostoma ceylanicum]|uniref:Uncharacterized protein n=1 Tax=Ancylostoma ceylanicum TaxID=53326 RepID=A0A016VQS4_9BILA|nr:hypothetical protein Y032_0006g3111 [Ancylostoma ceylanicum]
MRGLPNSKEPLMLLFLVLLVTINISSCVVIRNPVIWRKPNTIEMLENGTYADFVKKLDAEHASRLTGTGAIVSLL